MQEKKEIYDKVISIKYNKQEFSRKSNLICTTKECFTRCLYPSIITNGDTY